MSTLTYRNSATICAGTDMRRRLKLHLIRIWVINLG